MNNERTPGRKCCLLHFSVLPWYSLTRFNMLFFFSWCPYTKVTYAILCSPSSETRLSLKDPERNLQRPGSRRRWQTGRGRVAARPCWERWCLRIQPRFPQSPQWPVTLEQQHLMEWNASEKSRITRKLTWLTEYALSTRVGKTAGVNTRAESNVAGWHHVGKEQTHRGAWVWGHKAWWHERDIGSKRGREGRTFLWQQQSSAERADRMTVQAINTSSKLIRTRLKLIWRVFREDTWNKPLSRN